MFQLNTCNDHLGLEAVSIKFQIYSPASVILLHHAVVRRFTWGQRWERGFFFYFFDYSTHVLGTSIYLASGPQKAGMH